MGRLGPAHSLLHRSLEQGLGQKILNKDTIIYYAELTTRRTSFDMKPVHADRQAHIQIEVRSRRVHGDYAEPVSADISGLLKSWEGN